MSLGDRATVKAAASHRTPKKAILFGGGFRLLGVAAGFGIFGGPVFRREGYAPELRTASGEFQADFGFVAAHRAKKSDVTFLLFLGGVVAQHQEAAAGDARLQQNQRAMGVDGQSVTFFIEWLALRVGAVYSNAELHQDALASATATCVGWIGGKFGHGVLARFDYTAGFGVPVLDAGKG
jgi:hypothetical protein